ncbi:MAG: PilN domain-containing protein [Candidatus Nanopelagicales bacterium]
MVSFGRKGSTAEVEAPEEQVAPAAQPVAAAPRPAPIAAFPRVNLIPDEIAQEARVRQAKLVLAGAVAASIVAAAGLYVMAAGEVSAAQTDLDAQTARSAALAAEVTRYADVPKVKADLASAQQQQALALGGEVRWSFVLNNLALTIPQGTSLTSLKGSINGTQPTEGAATGPTTGGVVSVLGQPGIGSITFEGEAYDNAKVASFLEAITRNNGALDPFATQATKDGGSNEDSGSSGRSIVRFTASTTLGAKALSHRYDVKGN